MILNVLQDDERRTTKATLMPRNRFPVEPYAVNVCIDRESIDLAGEVIISMFIYCVNICTFSTFRFWCTVMVMYRACGNVVLV